MRQNQCRMGQGRKILVKESRGEEGIKQSKTGKSLSDVFIFCTENERAEQLELHQTVLVVSHCTEQSIDNYWAVFVSCSRCGFNVVHTSP